MVGMTFVPFRSSTVLLLFVVWGASAAASSLQPRWNDWLRWPAFVRRGGSNDAHTIDADADAAAATALTNDESSILISESSTNQSSDTDLSISSTDDSIISNRTATTNTNTTKTKPAALPLWKQCLPEILQRKGPNTLQKINLLNVEIYLLGTAHVSNDSSMDVKLLLKAVQPDCIFVELCEARIALLEGDNSNNNNDMEDVNVSSSSGSNKNNAIERNFWDRLDQIRQSQGGSRLQALSTLLLTSVQEDYAETLGVELGGEFRAAHLYWKEACRRTGQSNPSLVLGDRPLSLTLVRAWESLWWWPKTKVLAGLLWSSLRKPNPEEIRAWLESVLQEETDVLTTSLQELRKHFPSLYDTIIAERDAWLACKLVQTSQILQQQQAHITNNNQQQQQRKTRLVAIVGAGHVPGIIQWLTNTTTTLPPEQVLKNLTATKRWANHAIVQQEMIPVWTQEVTQVHPHFDENNDPKGEWSWTEPSMPTAPP